MSRADYCDTWASPWVVGLRVGDAAAEMYRMVRKPTGLAFAVTVCEFRHLALFPGPQSSHSLPASRQQQPFPHLELPVHWQHWPSGTPVTELPFAGITVERATKSTCAKFTKLGGKQEHKIQTLRHGT